MSSDDLSSSDSEASANEDDTDPNAIDEPPLDDNDDVTEDDADEAFETGFEHSKFVLFFNCLKTTLSFVNTKKSTARATSGGCT